MRKTWLSTIRRCLISLVRKTKTFTKIIDRSWWVGVSVATDTQLHRDAIQIQQIH